MALQYSHFAETVVHDHFVVQMHGTRSYDDATGYSHHRISATYKVTGCWSDSVTVRWETDDQPYGSWSSGGIDGKADNATVLVNLSDALSDAATLVRSWREADIAIAFEAYHAAASQKVSS